MYVLVRRDIPVAQQIVQVGHACYEAGHKEALHQEAGAYQKADNTHLIVMTVKDEIALEYAVEDLTVEGTMFWEPDNNTGNSAWASVPVRGKDREQFRFPMWKN